MKPVLLLSMTVCALLPILVHAQGVPDTLSIQGFVMDDVGIPIDNPSATMTFKLYKGGASVWEEAHAGVAVTGGVFNVLLGGTTSLEGLVFDAPFELGITVGGDSEMSPRTPLSAVPFALGMRGMSAVWVDDGNNQSLNMMGGAPNNTAAPGVVGATIGGGGGTSFTTDVGKAGTKMPHMHTESAYLDTR